MSSRVEEKERRRQERLAQEQAAAKAAARRRRLQLVAGAILVLAMIGAVVAIAAGGGGGGADDGPSDAEAPSGVKIPAPGDFATDLNGAAEAAGCTFKAPKIEGRAHVERTATYKSNPPTSGAHSPEPAQDGKYDTGKEPGAERWLHSLEHGRVVTLYRAGSPGATVDKLSALFDERVNGTRGYHQILAQNGTKMPYAVAAVAWGKYVGCPDMNDKVFDVIRAFRARFIDKGPEFVP